MMKRIELETRQNESRGTRNPSPRQKGYWLLATGYWLLLLFTVLLPAKGTAVSQTTTSIRGVVKDADGKPLTSVRVGAIDQVTATMHEAQTDASGQFQIHGLEPTTKHRLVIIKYGYQVATLDDVTPGGSDITVTLKPQLRPLRTTPPEARSSSPPTSSDETPSVELSSKLVVLNVSVKDAGNKPVPDLKKTDFTVYEDGEAQDIAFFAEEDTPLSVILLMDVSGSMEGDAIEEAKRAAQEFISHNNPQNEIALVAFNHQVRVLQPFTRDRAQIRSAIAQLSASGGTSLYDVVAKAIEMLSTAHYSRHIILLFSDGKDENSRKKYSEVEKLVQASDVTIFGVGEYSEAERKMYMNEKKHDKNSEMENKYYKDPPLEVNLSPAWVMRQLSEISGGGAFFPRQNDPLEPLFALIARELQHQYGIGYLPPVRSGEPKFRSIEVRVKADPKYGQVLIRTRKGYLE